MKIITQPIVFMLLYVFCNAFSVAKDIPDPMATQETTTEKKYNNNNLDIQGILINKNGNNTIIINGTALIKNDEIMDWKIMEINENKTILKNLKTGETKELNTN